MGAAIRCRVPRCGSERGGVMLLAMLTLTGLAGLGALALLVTQGGMRAASHDRFQGIAMRAAESGIAAGMSFLRAQHDPSSHWSELVSPGNGAIQSPDAIPGNRAAPGTPGALLSADLDAWYEVSILNNPADPGFATGGDSDARVILRSVGHGPDGATVILEVEVSGLGLAPLRGRCGAYGQRGLAEDGAGRDDCLGTVDPTSTVTYRPGE